MSARAVHRKADDNADESKGNEVYHHDDDGAGAGAVQGAAHGGGAETGDRTGNGAGGGAGAGPQRDLSRVLGVHIPGFFLVRGAFNTVWSLTESLIGPLFGLRSGAIPSRSDEASRFRLDFAQRYADGDQERCPHFVAQSFRAAVEGANRQSRPIFIYLHSSFHADSDQFCRYTLCDPAVAQYINDNFVVWGGDVTSADGYDTMGACQVSSFPHTAIYVPSSTRNQYQKLWAHEGPASSNELLTKVRAAMAAGAEHVGRIVAQRVAREEDRRLRLEQEQAYKESEERDRAKEHAKALEAERAALEEAKAMSVELAKEADIQRARNMLPPEPDHAGRDAPGGPTTTLRFTLPSGTRVQRRFKSTDTLEVVRQYVLVTLDDMAEIPDHIDPTSFELSTTFPKKTFTAKDEANQQSLQEADLVPQGVLFVAWGSA